MTLLPKTFSTRNALIDHVKKIAPWAEGAPSAIVGGHTAAMKQLHNIDPVRYEQNRNFGNGNVTRLSPHIHHGTVSLNKVRNHIITRHSNPQHVTKLLQELTWRTFWQYIAEQHPEWIWNDAEPYKTGYTPDDYRDTLPDDIEKAQTGVACIDAFINELHNTGHIHNHARMYIASYVVHFRRIKWQVGAQWFLRHLLDGDEASNNLSWQWIASTLSNKPYIFNLENVRKYFGELVDTTPKHNDLLDKSYDTLSKQLFPHIN